VLRYEKGELQEGENNQGGNGECDEKKGSREVLGMTGFKG